MSNVREGLEASQHQLHKAHTLTRAIFNPKGKTLRSYIKLHPALILHYGFPSLEYSVRRRLCSLVSQAQGFMALFHSFTYFQLPAWKLLSILFDFLGHSSDDSLWWWHMNTHIQREESNGIHIGASFSFLLNHKIGCFSCLLKSPMC